MGFVRFPLSSALIACAALTACGMSPIRPDESEANHGNDTHILGGDAEMKVHAVMNGILRDPDSAKYKCWPLRAGKMSGPAGVFSRFLVGWIQPCEINSKNAFNGYTGWVNYGFLFIGDDLCRAVEYGREGLIPTERVIYNNAVTPSCQP